jgi:histidine triad (HIT) family protein
MSLAAQCLFCKIIRREIPADIVYEDDYALAFRDIRPVAPVHALVIPKVHIESVTVATAEHSEILGRTLLAAGEVARKLGVVDGGYRLVVNNGADAGQSVFHIHVHVLGGRGLAWPPG